MSVPTRAPARAADVDPPLYAVRFAVVDVETTGGSPQEASLTEIGAALFEGGELVESFETLVDPGCEVPPFISTLTGITDAMVRGAPEFEEVAQSLLGMLDGTVVVGHNVGFDVGFLDAALVGSGHLPLRNPTVDTLAMARALMRPEVPDCSLATLAAALELPHRPAHRALADALATADLLHRLLEEAAAFGVVRLGTLLDPPWAQRRAGAAAS